jgi:hypothetical protein
MEENDSCKICVAYSFQGGKENETEQKHMGRLALECLSKQQDCGYSLYYYALMIQLSLIN